MSPAITPRWSGEVFVVCGAGPSLSIDDLNYCRAVTPRPRVIVVNDAYRLAPWADVLYAADAQWWQWQQDIPDDLLPALKFAAQPQAREFRQSVQIVNTRGGAGISTDRTYVNSGGHGGHQAINLAVHLGAKDILLLGFDMSADRDGRNHFFGEHPNGHHPRYAERLRNFGPLKSALDAINISITNCSRMSAIPDHIIRRRPLVEVLR